MPVLSKSKDTKRFWTMKYSSVNDETQGGFWEIFARRCSWLFWKSGVMALALEHFLAMMPATILVPMIVNDAYGTMVIDMSLVLLTSGLGTILFVMFSKGKIPAYLGSSFAYIGLTVYLIQENIATGASPAMAYTYVGWAYAFSGILIVLLSFLYRIKGIERWMDFLFPATVVGPAISLIGLELADTAIVDAGFDLESGLADGSSAIVSISTLLVIIFFSLVYRKKFKNSAIITGVLVGSVLYFAINGFPNNVFSDVELLSLPKFHFPVTVIPPNLLGLFVSVIPATLIVFTENIGRITVIGRMIGDTETEKKSQGDETVQDEVINYESGDDQIFTVNTVKKIYMSLFCHGVSMIACVLSGSVPNTIYAENIAVMSIHRTSVQRVERNKGYEDDSFIKELTSPYSYIPYIVAAFIAILFSFVGILQDVLLLIPKPVIGGMELFLFGIISAPGIQLLVEQRVNYKKISNQIVTAAVLLAGVSGLSVNMGIVKLEGMGLGFIVGLVLNLVVQCIKFLGRSSDQVSFEEIIYDCLSFFSPQTKLRVLGYQRDGETHVDYSKNYTIHGVSTVLSGKDCSVKNSSGQWILDDILRDELRHSNLVVVGLTDNGTNIECMRFKKTEKDITVYIHESRINKRLQNAYTNDYEAIDIDGEWLSLNISKNIPMRCIRRLIREVEKSE